MSDAERSRTPLPEGTVPVAAALLIAGVATYAFFKIGTWAVGGPEEFKPISSLWFATFALAPGFFPSKMTRATLETTGKLIREWTPTRRLGNDEDLKGLAVLLASEASRHITGQAIAVDGGATVV